MDAYRWEPSCACGWIGRARVEREPAERAAENHARRDCDDSDPRTRVDWRSLASIRNADR